MNYTEEITRIITEAKNKKINLPKPYTVMVLSWEDIVAKCIDENKKATPKDIIEIFEHASRKMNDSMVDDFWSALEYFVNEHKFGKDNE